MQVTLGAGRLIIVAAGRDANGPRPNGAHTLRQGDLMGLGLRQVAALATEIGIN